MCQRIDQVIDHDRPVEGYEPELIYVTMAIS